MQAHVIATRIKKERNALGYSQTDLGKKLSTAPQTVNGWESGRRIPDVEMLSVLADMFGCSVDYLLGRTDNKKASVIDEYVGKDHVKIELDKDYFSTLTPADVKSLLNQLKEVGFDLNKLI